MIIAALMLGAAIHLTAPKTNITLTLTWATEYNIPSPSYDFYWGPDCYQTNEISTFTNWVTVTFPLDGQYYYAFVRNVNSSNVESIDSNEIHWPLFEVHQFSGTNLQCSADLKSWTLTNNPWQQTNVTDKLFFRLKGTTNNPIHSKWLSQ